MKKQNIQPHSQGKQNAAALLDHLKWLEKNPKSEIEILREQIFLTLERLRLLAKKQPKALAEFAALLKYYIEILNWDVLESVWRKGEKSHYKRLIQKCESWPAVISAYKPFNAGQVKFAKNMGIGKNSPFKYNGHKIWDRTIPQNRAILSLSPGYGLRRLYS